MARPERLKSSLGNLSPLDPMTEVVSSAVVTASPPPAWGKSAKTKRTF